MNDDGKNVMAEVDLSETKNELGLCFDLDEKSSIYRPKKAA